MNYRKLVSFIFSYLLLTLFCPQLLAQELNLTELIGLPDGIKIEDAKLYNGSLYVAGNGSLYKYSTANSWSTITLNDSLEVATELIGVTYGEIFDVNDFGQFIVRMVIDENYYWLTAENDFQDIRIQRDIIASYPLEITRTYNSQIFYVAKDTILITSSECTDQAGYYSLVSTDAGLTWIELDQHCMGTGKDFVRIRNNIYWYGGLTRISNGFGPQIWYIGEEQFDLTTLEISNSILYTYNDIDPGDPIFLNVLSNYVTDDGTVFYASGHNSFFPGAAKFNTYMGSVFSDDLIELGNGPGGSMKAGPNNEGIFIYNNRDNTGNIFYRLDPFDDFVQLSTNISDLENIRDIIQDSNNGVYVITKNKIYFNSDGILPFDQRISGNIYWDMNGDCMEAASDSIFRNLIFQLEYDNNTVLTHYTVDGAFDFPAPAGKGKLIIYGVNLKRWELCQDELDFDIGLGGESINNIGIKAIKDCQSLKIYSASLESGACFDTEHQFRIVNDGTLITDPYKLELALPDELSFLSASTSYEDLGNNNFALDVPPLGILEEYFIKVQSEVSCMSMGGDTICTTLKLSVANSCEIVNVTDTICTKLLLSYDPNRMTVMDSQSTIDTFFEKEEPQLYQIDFQNTGDFAARDVRLETYISEALDIETFEFIASSHDYEINFENYRTLVVTYKDIILPDSMSNLAGSQGYFKYKILPVEGIEDNTRIFNHANIYFDFNEPVRTNDALAWIAKSVSTTSINQLTFQSYPNPTDGVLYLSGLDLAENYNYQMISIDGQLMDSGNISGSNSRLDLLIYQSGMYFLRLRSSEGRSGTVKVVRH